MKTFKNYLDTFCEEKGLIEVLVQLSEAVKEIAEVIKINIGEKAGTENVFGEDQLTLDLQANKISIEQLRKTAYIGIVASEEMDEEVRIGNGEYAACFDPLDGSSLVDVNLTVGSIYGVYKTDTFIGVKGDDQLAALVAVYGPRTTMLLTIGDEVVEFLLNGSEDFVLSRERLVVKEEGKMFAPGNLRACKTNEGYKELMNYWCAEQYTLRYSGGMVPDINQILIKGKGVFTYPGYEAAPEGKLRVLYECAPMALLMERAGGLATDGNRRILEIEVGSLDQRTPVLMGSIKEVQKAEEYLAR